MSDKPCPGYRPDYQAMGDCANCGQVRESHEKFDKETLERVAKAICEKDPRHTFIYRWNMFQGHYYRLAEAAINAFLGKDPQEKKIEFQPISETITRITSNGVVVGHIYRTGNTFFIFENNGEDAIAEEVTLDLAKDFARKYFS